MADRAAGRTEGNFVVTRVSRAHKVFSDVCLSASADPVARERPRCAAPDLVSTEHLKLRALVRVDSVDSGRDSVYGGVQDARCTRVAESELYHLLVQRGAHGGRETAIDGRPGFIANGRDNDGLGLLREAGGQVEGVRDQLTILDGPDWFRCTSGGIELVVCRGVKEVVLGGHDGVQRQRVQTGRVGDATVEVLCKVAEHFLMNAGREESKVLG